MQFRKINFLIPLLLALFTIGLSQDQKTIKTPQQYYNFKPGSNGRLIDYASLIGYLTELSEASPRSKLLKIGESPLGRNIYINFISSAENIARLNELKAMNRELALNADLKNTELDTILRSGKVFVLATMSMHSNEVGPSQAVPLIAHELVTTQERDKLHWLEATVLMLVPCHNPDGMDMVVEHYEKYKGTKYEGSSLPGVYHKYVGHDNNRDFVTLTQSDTRAIADIYNRDWFPQVMVEKHQMGMTGPRYFAPPMHDPISEHIDARLWNWTWIFGSNIVKDMTHQGLSGVSQHYLFDDYWPGSTETCVWKNVIGMLTECASAKYATPVFVEPEELKVYGKGLAEYKKSINMVKPWPGGWWGLDDIVEYELASTWSVLKTAALHKEAILKVRSELCKDAVRRGKTNKPYYYAIPLDQHDESELVQLLELLKRHGIDIYRLNKDMTIEGRAYRHGDIFIPLAQPFRPFLKEVMERQYYPERHYTPDGELIKPYDITSWSLPLHRGIDVYKIETESGLKAHLSKSERPLFVKKPTPDSFRFAVFSPQLNESYKAAFSALEKGLRVERLLEESVISGERMPVGSIVIFPEGNIETFKKLSAELNISPNFVQSNLNLSTETLRLPSIGVVASYFHDMDAGWTRFVFDRYHISYEVIRPSQFKDTDLTDRFDLILFPDEQKSILLEGKWKSEDEYYISSYPPEFTEGMEEDGLNNLIKFIQDGGRVLSWGNSVDLFMGTQKIKEGDEIKEEFQLPVKNRAKELKKKGLYVPGALVKIKLRNDHPLTLGMPEDVGVFYRADAVFSTSIPKFDMDRRVVASFPERDALLSGYSEGTKLLERHSAMVWLKKGAGELILCAFNPQFRASTQATYKLIFNAVLSNQQ